MLYSSKEYNTGNIYPTGDLPARQASELGVFLAQYCHPSLPTVIGVHLTEVPNKKPDSSHTVI